MGNTILRALHISMEALQLSGGVLLFLVAMQLLTGKGDLASPDADDSNVAMVPLGTPVLAGPGSIVAVMMAVSDSGNTVPGWVAVMLAVILIHVVVYLTLRFSVSLGRLLGENGVTILTKIAGVLLAAIATQLTADAVFRFISAYQAG